MTNEILCKCGAVHIGASKYNLTYICIGSELAMIGQKGNHGVGVDSSKKVLTVVYSGQKKYRFHFRHD